MQDSIAIILRNLPEIVFVPLLFAGCLMVGASRVGTDPMVDPVLINVDYGYVFLEEEKKLPVWLDPNAVPADLLVPSSGLSFRFRVDSGFTYSITVDAESNGNCNTREDYFNGQCGRLELTCKTAGFAYENGSKADELKSISFEFSTSEIPGNFSPPRTAVILEPDTVAQVAYVHVRSEEGQMVAGRIRLTRFREKIFGPPIQPADPGINGIAYFNQFGYRARLRRDRPTYHGHNGLDVVTMYGFSRGGWNADRSPAIAVADGTVLRTLYQGCVNGSMAWIRHDTPVGVFTSLYVHLDNVMVKPGDRVRKGELVGTLLSEPLCPDGFSSHLHFEMWRGVSTNWDNGYSGGSGQIDPLSVLFTY